MMNKEDLNRLLDNIYELEGLVHLAINRDDCPGSLPVLIARKGREMARMAEKTAGMAAEPEPDAEASFEPEAAFEPETRYVAEEMPKAEPAAGEVRIEEPAKERIVVAESVEEPKGRLVFSINDRYRFKRELFNNSDADFNNTLALVASMEGYDEAEDYFLGELQWDSKNREVADFLEILKKYFKE